MNLQDTPNAIIKFLAMDYSEIPSVLTVAEKTLPKYKGSVQPYQAAFLYWLTQKHVPTYGNILEVGTGLGYTSWTMATAKPKALITTLNPNADECKIANKTLQEFSNVGVLKETSRGYFAFENSMEYDLIFIDGNHNDIAFDCRWYGRLADNGIIVFHDYSAENSWSACPPVFDYLNIMRTVWGDETYLVRDDGNVGMIGWQKIVNDNELNELSVETISLMPV